jgi:TetR/AcrR family transcriptional regulator, cholesterol catabolism regulator
MLSSCPFSNKPAMHRLQNLPDEPVDPKQLKKGLRKPKDERWAQILDVAAQVFFEKGYDATSLQDIANRTGILKGSIYYYIKTKEDLLASLLQEAHEKGLRTIRPIATGAGDPIHRLAAMIRCHVDFVCNDRARTAVFLHERQRLSEGKRKEYLGDEHAYPQLFRRVIVEGQKEKLIHRRLDPHLTALCLIGSLNSLYEWFQLDGKFSVSAIGEHYIAVTLSGMTTPEGVASLGTRPDAKRRRNTILRTPVPD